MKTPKLLSFINIFLCLTLISTTNTFAHKGATGIVKERMDKFKESKQLMKKINSGLQNENFKVIEESAQMLLLWSKEMHNFFPEGSDVSPSEASSDIWLNPEDFNKAIKNFELASLKLINQSNTNDRDNTINAFRNLASTCKGCHEKFRN
ncbi:cytochrome c [Pseudomonadota bacterium]|nr:cytochrome c [Pseudomonadota bacterium]|tara:strand:- start:317 stop:766 length:450 start_codon:yes stop_codon:yes gene_type:complete